MSGFYGFRNVAEKFCVPWVLPLVKRVAVWMPMLTHIQASHTDALKTHSPQTFLPHDWEVKGGQQFFGTSISRKKIDIGVVPALQEEISLVGRISSGRPFFSIAVILPVPFHGMSTKTQVSGMRLLHVDTSAPLL